MSPSDIDVLKEKRDVEGLIKALKYNKNPIESESVKVRSNAAKALGDIGNDVAIDALINALKDPDEDVKFHVARNLGKFGESAVPFLIDALKDPDEHVRRYAAWILGNIGDNQAIPALKNLLNDPSDYVRNGAAHALERFI